MAKKYKPGQFCSLGGVLYRVKRINSRPPTVFVTCTACRYKCFGDANDRLFRDCVEKLPAFCYPIPLKPKHQG